MATSSPSTPSRRSDVDLVQLVNDFSRKWDLGLKLDTVKLSPQARQSRILNEGGETAARCISSIRFLFFKDRDCLEECLEVFGTRATRLLLGQSNIEGESPSALSLLDRDTALATSRRQKLLHLLLSILKPHYDRILKGRLSIGHHQQDVSPSSSSTQLDLGHQAILSAVDGDIAPLVFRQKEIHSSSDREHDGNDQGNFRPSLDARSAYASANEQSLSSPEPDQQSTATSLVIPPALTLLNVDIAPSRPTLYQSELEPRSPSTSSSSSYSTAPEDSLSEEHESFSQKAIARDYVVDSGYNSFQSAPFVDDVDRFSDNETSYGSTVLDEEYDLPLPVKPEVEKLDPFEEAFPTLPAFLKNTPFYVRYEVIRIFAHAKVTIPQNLTLPSFKDYNDFWSCLKDLPALKGKKLPERTSSKVWAAAIAKEKTKSPFGICITATLTIKKNKIVIEFDPLKLELQSRLSRKFGADRFLTIGVPSPKIDFKNATATENQIHSRLIKWISRSQHSFLNRTWQWFSVTPRDDPTIEVVENNMYREERKIYLHDHFFFATQSPDFDTSRFDHKNMKLGEMLRWLIPLEENQEQSYLKLFSRISLGQSRTRETITLEPNEIEDLDDLKPDIESKLVMNDGCGRMSRKMAIAIRDKLGLHELPSAFQGRIGGAKGLWLLDTENNGSSGIWIKIYGSQTKWKRDPSVEYDPAHRTFEVSTTSTPCRPARVNEQFIAVLDHGETTPQIMRQILATILKDELRFRVEQVNDARESPQKLRRWVQIESGNRQKESTAICYLGGLPEEYSDQINMLLDAGFLPNKLEFIEDRVQKMFSRKLQSLKDKFHIIVPKSTNTFIGVDFSGQLKEDEVHLTFSRPFIEEITGESLLFLDGKDILVSRSPAHLPSDIQKVKARYIPQLKDIKDVTLFSRKGSRPLADKLSGGDYDGDRCWICWDENIVNNFQNKPEPGHIDFYKEGYLTKDKATYEDILSEGHADPVQVFLERSCIFNTKLNFLGICTNFKKNITQANEPLDSRASLRLGLLCSKLVDAAKQGDILTEDSWNKMKKEINKELSRTQSNKDNIVRYLNDVIIETVRESERKIKKTIHKEDPYDKDLTILAEDFERRSKTDGACKEVYMKLKDDINNVKQAWSIACSRKNRKNKFQECVLECYTLWHRISPNEEDINILKESSLFPDIGLLSEEFGSWTLLKASVTYKKYPNGNFPWWMCGKQLAFMKAMKEGLSPLSNRMAVILKAGKVVFEKEEELVVDEVGGFENDDNGEFGSDFDLDSYDYDN
ncbi:hypothetical protein B7463_g7905, partial [Scytalidium lignicola]